MTELNSEMSNEKKAIVEMLVERGKDDKVWEVEE